MIHFNVKDVCSAYHPRLIFREKIHWDNYLQHFWINEVCLNRRLYFSCLMWYIFITVIIQITNYTQYWKHVQANLCGAKRIHFVTDSSSSIRTVTFTSRHLGHVIQSWRTNIVVFPHYSIHHQHHSQELC